MIPTSVERDALLARLEKAAGGLPAGGPSWLRRLREEAADRFSDLGVPTSRSEEWKFTSLAPLAALEFGPRPEAADLPADALAAAIPAGLDEAHRIVFVDGRFSPRHSRLEGLPDGVRLESLAAALASDPELVEEEFGRLAPGRGDAMVSLATAFAEEGAFLRVARRVVVERPIHLLFVGRPSASRFAIFPRLLANLGDGAEATLVESWVGLGGGAAFTNAVFEIALGDGARLAHVRVQDEARDAVHLAATHVRQGRDATYESFSVSVGAALSRHALATMLAGEGASCRLLGLYLADGEQHADHATSIDHAVPHGRSEELYKGILDDRATAVFGGRVLVRKDAQKTSAAQSNRNLLLSDLATVDTRPQLEILADDVRCSHGATIGQLEEQSIFYLRSRGLAESDARDLLTWAFAGEIVHAVPVPAVRRALSTRLLARLPIDLRLAEEGA